MSPRQTALTFTLAALGAAAFLPINVAAASGSEDEARTQWSAALKDAILSFGHLGCFSATFPDPTPLEVPCLRRQGVATPRAPTSKSSSPEAVGGPNDYVAISVTPSIGTISTTLETISGVTEEYDTKYDALNTYSLQLNTNRWAGSAACGSLTGCMAWQQFIYDYTTHGLYIEYWLINYPDACKNLGPDWNRSQNNCYFDGGGTPVPQIKVNALQGAWFEATTYGPPYPLDYLQFNLPDGSAYITTSSSVLGLSGNFKTAEFNIFGTVDGSYAVFNQGSQITLTLYAGTPLICSPKPNGGTTAEHNNLFLKGCNVLKLGGTLDMVQIIEGN